MMRDSQERGLKRKNDPESERAVCGELTCRESSLLVWRQRHSRREKCVDPDMRNKQSI